MTTLTTARMPSPLGPFHLLFNQEQLLYAGFSDYRTPGVRLPSALRTYLAGTRVTDTGDAPRTGISHVDTLKRQLEAYFNGEAINFDVSLQLYGSPFQLSVWNYLLTIENSGTRTYGQVAAESGYPRAVRAVGSAVGSNPISIIVPCHRILPASGGIGNYGGGSDRKEFLLQLEHARI